jgi:hypothetical protein
VVAEECQVELTVVALEALVLEALVVTEPLVVSVVLDLTLPLALAQEAEEHQVFM